MSNSNIYQNWNQRASWFFNSNSDLLLFYDSQNNFKSLFNEVATNNNSNFLGKYGNPALLIPNSGIRSVGEFMILISNLQLLFPQDRFLYRGESKSYTIPFFASLHRNIPSRNLITDKDINQSEIDDVTEFQNSPTGLQLQIDYPIVKNLDHMAWWSLTQHYSEMGKTHRGDNYCTRLIDVTSNPLVSLYFALNKNSDDDGWVFVIHNSESQFGSPSSNYQTWKDHINDILGYYSIFY